MTLTVTPTPRDARGMTAIRYTVGRIHGSVVFNRPGKFVGASKEGAIGSTRVRWLEDPQDLPAGVYEAAWAAYLETLT